MKRLFALLLALVMLLTLTACGSGEEGATTGESTGTTVNTTENTNDPTNGTQSTTESTTDGDAVGATEPPATTTPTTESTPDTTTPIPTEPKPTESPTTEPLVTEPPVTEPSEPEPIKTTSVALSVSSVKLFVGEKATVTATVKPNNATDKTIKWTSSNTAIATVANGIVTAHKVGTATITATASGGQTATCKVTVEQKEEPKPTEPPATEPAVPTVQEKKYTGYEIVSVYSPEQALLTRFYGGANKAFCKNDSMTIQINMSNGKATEEDLSVELPYGCSYSISGNRITFVFDGSRSWGGGKIVVKNSDGTKNEIPIDVTVVRVTSLSSNTAELKDQFVTYGKKRGLTFIPNGTDFVLKYNGGYTKDDKTKSITGCTIVGTDDYISMSDNSNWIYDALDLVDEYNRRGFDKWTFRINAYSFTTLAE